jgi:hypothetical protein
MKGRLQYISSFILSCKANCTSVFSGERTFGVLTKIDLMDKGTDAVDVSLYDFECFCLVPVHIICACFSLSAVCNVA